MQHFKPDQPKKDFPFRQQIIDCLEKGGVITDEELLKAIDSEIAKYVEVQRINHLTSYAKIILH